MAPSPKIANGPTFLVKSAMNATMQIAKLFQSMKFSGVASPRAAVPISPNVAGLSHVITPLKR